eukprot:jgi/Botrbrau1/6109/Bobra.331_2s0005.2
MAIVTIAAVHLFVMATAIAALKVTPAPSGSQTERLGGSRFMKYTGPANNTSATAQAPKPYTVEVEATATQDEAPGLESDPSTHGSHFAGIEASGAVHRAPSGIPGFDVSSWQSATLAWSTYYSQGARFAYIKATEGTTYKSPNFSKQYTDAYYAGYIRGAYHYAQPASSSGAAQATYFAKNGGGWSKDGKTLPGMLDIEYGPTNKVCYGLSQSAMVAWITDFHKTYTSLTGRYPVIYTTTDWWKTCTGNTAKFASTSPLFIARYASTVGTLPAGWSYYTFWQYSSSGPWPGDSDVFNGGLSQLKVLACNGPC